MAGGLARPVPRHLPGLLLVIWDRSKTHRRCLVEEFVAGE